MRDCSGLGAIGKNLGRSSQLLEETKHICGCGQEKVAKIVQCGDQHLMSAYMLFMAVGRDDFMRTG